MVGHSGVVDAGIAAVEATDQAVKAVVEKTLSLGGKASHHRGPRQLRTNAEILMAALTLPIQQT